MKSAPLLLKVQRLVPEAVIPHYASAGAACFDLHSASGTTVVPPGKAATVTTGLAFEVPEGHVLLAYSRSGHGFNHGVRLVNSTGVIDSDYRGAVQVRLHNDSAEPFTVWQGDRVAQAMLMPIPTVALKDVKKLSTTKRGTAGLGSTGA